MKTGLSISAPTLVLCLTAVLSLTAVACAQPVLDEVERDVRRQVGAPALAADGTPAAPAAQPGYLGVVADDRGENGRGIRIREVVPGGPAAQAGLQSGDLVTAVNGRPMRVMDDMAQTLSPLPAGQRVEFQVDRAGTLHKASVVLGNRPAKAERRFAEFGKQPDVVPGPPENGASDQQPITKPAANTSGGPLLGVRSVPLTADLRRRFAVPAEIVGTLISAVTVGSPADRAGLSPGMLITALNGQAVNSPDALTGLVRQAGAGREVELTCWDQSGPTRRRVTLAGIDAPPTSLPGPSPDDIPEPQVPPPAAAAGPVSPSATELLERRIQQLEARLDRLEAALREKRGNP